MITVDSDTSGLIKKIGEARAVTGQTLAAVLRSEGRLLAVELAMVTQPYGFDNKALQQGEAALARDYRKIYITDDNGLALVMSCGARAKDRPAAQIRFDNYAKAGNGGALDKVMQDMHLKIDYARTAKPSYHDRRWKNGRLHKGANLAVLNPKSVGNLIKREQRKVGFAKSGWAACARELGGTRGIPQWVTRGKCPGRVIVDYKGPENITVTLINEGNFTSRVLSQGGKALAISNRIQKIQSVLDMTLKRNFQKI